MGYNLNCFDEPVFMAGPKPMLTEFDIDHRLESCAYQIEERHLVPFAFCGRKITCLPHRGVFALRQFFVALFL